MTAQAVFTYPGHPQMAFRAKAGACIACGGIKILWSAFKDAWVPCSCDKTDQTKKGEAV